MRPRRRRPTRKTWAAIVLSVAVAVASRGGERVLLDRRLG
jgi:hypothetical protein